MSLRNRYSIPLTKACCQQFRVPRRPRHWVDKASYTTARAGRAHHRAGSVFAGQDMNKRAARPKINNRVFYQHPKNSNRPPVASPQNEDPCQHPIYCRRNGPNHVKMSYYCCHYLPSISPPRHYRCLIERLECSSVSRSRHKQIAARLCLVWP